MVNKLFHGSNARESATAAALALSGQETMEEFLNSANCVLVDKDKLCVADIEALYDVDDSLCRDERVCLFMGIDRASVIVQNKLLKLLEDGEMSFVLTAASLGPVLPTVKSRCMLMKADMREKKIGTEVIFSNLMQRSELMPRLHLKDEKDTQSFFELHKAEIKDVLKEWKDFFVKVFFAMNGGEKLPPQYDGITKLYSVPEIANILFAIEDDIKKVNYTKDDFYFLILRMSS